MHIAPLTLPDALHLATLWPAERTTLLGRPLWHVRTPYARTLALRMHDAPVGVVGAITFGATTQLTVHRIHPSMGSKRDALIEALLAQREAEGITTCSLVSAITDAARWNASGFVQQEHILHYVGGRFLQATRDEVVHYEPQHRPGPLHLDRKASGEDRSTLLLEHAYLGTVYADGHVVRGFSLPLLGEGLIVADAPHVGLELQRWLFPVQDHVLLPEGNAAHEHLAKQGYIASPIGVRMVRGAAHALNVERVYAWPWSLVCTVR